MSTVARIRAAVPWLCLVAALCWLLHAMGLLGPEVSPFGPFRAVDMLPLWLCGQAVERGLDPNDPAVLRAIFRDNDLHLSVGGFYNYYPPTACWLSIPFSRVPLDEAAPAFQVVAIGSVALTAVLSATAGRMRGRLAAGIAILVVMGLFAKLRVTRDALSWGQPGPLAAVMTGLALWGLGRRSDTAAGLGIGLGASIKVFPLLALFGALGGGRWRAVAVAALTVAVPVAGLVWLRTPVRPEYWLHGVIGFVDSTPHGPWLHQEPRWVLALWRWRIVGLGVPTLAAIAWSLAKRRPESAAPTAALALAAGGTAMAGTHHYHQAVQLLPVLGWLVAWPAGAGATGFAWVVAAAAFALPVGLGAMGGNVPPSALHWIPIGWGLWGLCLARWAHALRRG